MAVILDTNAVSALLAGDPGLGEVLAAERRHHLPVIAIGEYLYGLRGSRHRSRLEPFLRRLIRESHLLLVDESTAGSYAQVRKELRARGRPIPENDLWIAALARQHGQAVVSNHGHFDAVPDLPRLAW